MLDSSFWDNEYRRRRPIRYGWTRRLIEAPLNLRLESLFRRHLGAGHGKSILEIGCAPGEWLVHFNRVLGYDVHGVDYSPTGCQLTEETLARNGVSGAITCGDVLSEDFTAEHRGRHDVVYSLGVIEHFEDPTEMLRAHLGLLRSGGRLVIGLPNFGDGTAARKVLHWTGREAILLRQHNVRLMKLPALRRALEPFEEMDILALEYLGPLTLRWPPRYLRYTVNQLLGYLTMFLHSEALSSYIILVGRKR